MSAFKNLVRSILAASLLVTASTVWADESTQEPNLLAILRSESPTSEKAITCKQLAIHGSAAAVPELAKLLPDPELSSWARIALEAIPGEEASEALRSAADSLDGRLAIGMINSIGVRQDAQAVDTLTKRLADSDDAVASAAAVALGNIGNPAATAVLRQSLASAPAELRSAIAEGLVLCAERSHTDGQMAEAVAIYDELRAADLPKQRLIEATRGAILARGQEGIPLLLEQFRSDDRVRFRLALGVAREFPGDEVDQALAAELAKASPDRAALLIGAMADRPDTVVLAAILSSAQQGPSQVRLAAIKSLQRVGDDSCVPVLMKIAMDSEPQLVDAAKETLAEFPGNQVDQQIVALLPDSENKTQVLLLELVGRRRIDAVAEVMKKLDESDANVRRAALVALGETVSLEQLPALIGQVVSAQDADEQAIAARALQAASIRMADREACAAELAAALEESSTATKTQLLEILGAVGGTNALQTLADAAQGGDGQLLDTSSRLLGKWSSIDAAPVLLDLAKTAEPNKYRVRALRGYLGLARKYADGTQRAEMCRSAIEYALRPDEQKLALQVLKLRPSTAGLNVAVRAQQLPGLKQDATAATLAIAQKLGEKGIDVKPLISSGGLPQVDLEIIKAEYGSGSTFKDVTKVLQMQAEELALITLDSPSYNTSFGGDPTPGVVKQLRIEYRVNGKAGQASFPENSLILLPMPK